MVIAARFVDAGAADVGRVEDGRSARVELGHEQIDAAGRAGRAGEAGRRRGAGDVDVAGGVDRDRRGFVEAGAAEQPRVAQDRIDDQRLAPIEAAEGEADGAVGVQHVAAGDGDARLAFQLVGERGRTRTGAAAAPSSRSPSALMATRPAPESCSRTCAGSAPGLDEDVVLDLAVGAVVGDVDARDRRRGSGRARGPRGRPASERGRRPSGS